MNPNRNVIYDFVQNRCSGIKELDNEGNVVKIHPCTDEARIVDGVCNCYRSCVACGKHEAVCKGDLCVLCGAVA